MSRYIDADKLVKAVNERSTHWLNEWDTMGVLAVIDEQETADVKKVVRAHWRTLESGADCVCSNCRRYWIPKGDEYDFLFCPNCGAIMDEEVNNED